MVRAKVCIQEKKETADGEFEIKATVVYGGSEENDKFFVATPSGELTLGVLNAHASEQLQEGQEYYLDLTPAGE